MSVTTVGAPSTTSQPWTRGMRAAFLAVAIVVLLAVSFVVGRATVNSGHAPAIVPTSVSHSSIDSCRMGRAC